MKRIKLKTRLIHLLLFLTLSPAMLSAQNDDGGLFGLGPTSGNTKHRNRGGLFDPTLMGGYNLYNQHFGFDVIGGYELYNQSFGQEEPLGSGLLIMTVAGAGYALTKRKSNKKQ